MCAKNITSAWLGSSPARKGVHVSWLLPQRSVQLHNRTWAVPWRLRRREKSCYNLKPLYKPMQRVYSFPCQRHTKGELFQRGATPIVSRKTVESLNMSCLGEAWFDSSARRESKERGSCSLCFLEEKTLSDTSAGRQETARPSGVMSLVGWLQSVWGVTGEIKSSVCLCVWVEEGVRGLNGLHALVLNRRSATLRHD